MRRVSVLSSGVQGFSAKLAPKYEGPYKMIERKSPTVYEAFHVNPPSAKFLARV